MANMHCWDTLPAKFLEKVPELIPNEQQRQVVLNTFCQKKPITIRVNTLQTTVVAVEQIFKQQTISTKRVPWIDHALIVENATSQQLTSMPAYQQGDFYLQGLSSMLPVLILDPQPGEKILDLCAAPGSKTTHIAMLLKNTGELIANDKSRQRLYKLESVLNQSGFQYAKISNLSLSAIPSHVIHLSNFPGEIMWKKFPNYFDKTLVDVPCSMEGRFVATDPATYEDWAPKKVKQLSTIQKQLLRSAFFATKPGGSIVYSTCTLSPEENEEVVDWLYQQEKGNVAIENIGVNHLQTDHGLSQWKNHHFTPEIRHTIRLYPNEILEGFFVAKLRRLR